MVQLLKLFSHLISIRGPILKNFLQSENSFTINSVTTAEMTPKFNLRYVILKIFQQSERYIAIKYKLAEIIQCQRVQFSKFSVIRKV